MRSNMYNPPHPGEVLKGIYLEELNITVSEAANALGITRQSLSGIINCHVRITPEMSLRLGKAFKTDPEMWLNMQKNYDLWQAEQGSEDLLSKVSVIA